MGGVGSLAQQVAGLPEAEREKLLAEVDLEKLKWDWSFWGRPEQILPDDDSWMLALALAGRGWGKAVDVSTPVPTPDGWTTMGELCTGDRVFDEAGRVCLVLAAHEPYVPESAYRLEFSDGTWIDACAEHQWVTMDHAARKANGRRNHGALTHSMNWAAEAEVRLTSQVAATLHVGKRGDLNHSIPLAGPLTLPDAALPVDPWLLGYWLGDGGSSEAVLHVGDMDVDWVRRRVAETGEKHWARRARTAWRIALSGADVPLYTRLRVLGVLRNKHIPVEYLRAGEGQRRALLAGLLDSDGYVEKSKVEFTSVSETLAHGVLELARSLGAGAVLHKGVATLNGVEIGPKYRVTWRADVCPFQMPRKVARWVAPGAQALRTRQRMIMSAETVEPVLMRCITVDSANSMYLVGEGMIPTHNTRTSSEWVRKKARDMPGSYGHVVARTAADVRDVLVEGPSGILAVSAPGEKPLYEPSKRRLTWPNGTVATLFSSEVPDALRGPQSHWTVCDELATWNMSPDEGGLNAWQNARIGTRLGRNPQLLALTTPKRTQMLRELLDEISENSRMLVVRGRMADNIGNLSQVYLDTMEGLYGGTALAAQELDGEMLDDVEGALFRLEWLEASRVGALPAVSDVPGVGLYRPGVVVAVDPSVAERPRDEVGIVVMIGTGEREGYQRRVWVVEDLSGLMPPGEWARVVVDAARRWGAPVVAEYNQGGGLVRSALVALDPGVRVVGVHSRVGKALRAETSVLAAQQGRLAMVGVFPDLESQLVTWDPAAAASRSGRDSPDRLDAMVHGANAFLTEELRGMGVLGGWGGGIRVASSVAGRSRILARRRVGLAASGGLHPELGPGVGWGGVGRPG